jgi:hypothetical protein
MELVLLLDKYTVGCAIKFHAISLSINSGSDEE